MGHGNLKYETYNYEPKNINMGCASSKQNDDMHAHKHFSSRHYSTGSGHASRTQSISRHSQYGDPPRTRSISRATGERRSSQAIPVVRGWRITVAQDQMNKLRLDHI